jgi:hypothetical protein
MLGAANTRVGDYADIDMLTRRHDMMHDCTTRYTLRWTQPPGSAGSRSRRCHPLWTISSSCAN